MLSLAYIPWPNLEKEEKYVILNLVGFTYMQFCPQCSNNGGLVLRTTVVGSGGKEHIMLHLSDKGNEYPSLLRWSQQ